MKSFFFTPLLFFCVSLWALDIPPLQGQINDHAHLLSSNRATELENQLKQFEKDTSNQIVLFTIPSLEGESLEDYSIRVATTWKLGQKEKDNGVLLLIAKNDRKLRIEVGYGLEASLTDALSHHIINNEIVPHFKNGDFEEGIQAGLLAIMRVIEET